MCVCGACGVAEDENKCMHERVRASGSRRWVQRCNFTHTQDMMIRGLREMRMCACAYK